MARERLRCGQTGWLIERFYGYLVPARAVSEDSQGTAGGQVALVLAGRMAFRPSGEVYESREAARAAAEAGGVRLAGIWAGAGARGEVEESKSRRVEGVKG